MMSLFLAEVFLADEEPFCLVYNANLLHFVLNGQVPFFKAAAALPCTCQPSEGLYQNGLCRRLWQQEHAIWRCLLIDSIVDFVFYKEQHYCLPGQAGVNSKVNSCAVGQR